MGEKPSAVVPRDEQQARLIERLQAAGGDPVDFEELRAVGIEHPAVISYELEVAGLPIVQARDADRRTLALDQPADPLPDGPRDGEQGAAQRPSPATKAGEIAARIAALRERAAVGAGATAQWLRPRVTRAGERAIELGSHTRVLTLRGRAAIGRPDGKRRTISSARVARAALLAGVLALSLAATVALAVALINLTSTPRSSLGADATSGSTQRHGTGAANSAGRTASAPRRPAPSPPQASGGVPAPAPPAQPSGGVSGSRGVPAPAQPARVSPAAATALEAEGHQLLTTGDYGVAVDRLLGAIRASGQSLERCAEPTTEACLTFAYALYDLGRALRLKGEPGAAIPVLSERLRIDNQRAVVQHELALARGSGA
jgi:hypothetical protein